MNWRTNKSEEIGTWKEQLKQRYEEEADEYDRHRLKWVGGLLIDKIQKRRLMKVMQPKKEDSLLEIGFGSGRWLKFFYDNGYNTTGVDPSKNMHRICYKKFKRKHSADYKIPWLRLGDIENTTLPSDSFDIVYSMKVMRHLPDETISNGVKEMLRVLKPGGKIFIDFPHHGILTNVGEFFSLTQRIRSRIFSYDDVHELMKGYDYKIHYRFPRFLPEFRYHFYTYMNLMIDLLPLKKEFYSQILVEIRKEEGK